MANPVKVVALIALAFAWPFSANSQGALDAQEIANASGRIYNKEVRQKVVQGPTMTKRDVGEDGTGYVLWGYKDGQTEKFRLVALMYSKNIEVDAVTFPGLNSRPDFFVPRGAGNVQIDFGIDVYTHAVRHGLDVRLHGATPRQFSIPVEYFLGHYAWWKATYP